jgi:hypothetical protein
MAAETFGTRFLAEFRRLGGSTQSWPAPAVKAIEEADRRRFGALLAKPSTQIASDLRVAAHTAEPEMLARRALEHVHRTGGEWMVLLGALTGVQSG